MSTDFEAVFKAYDVRGTVGDQIDADGVRSIGGAFARFVRQHNAGSVIVGHDMRPEGAEFAAAFAAGVIDHGVDVIDVGLCSTEMMYYASGTLDMAGAVCTASHNPAGYNGIKMCLSGALPITEKGLADIKAMSIAGPDRCTTRGSRTEFDPLAGYVDHVRSFIDPKVLRPLKVVVDSANGMGGLVVPAVFEGLGFDLDHLYADLDGTFPNHSADPLRPENQRDLMDRVLTVGADLGIAYDGDADRVFFVDEQARPISGSATTALVARHILAQEPGATVVHNLICSRAVPEVIAECGGKAVISRVGHAYVKQLMARTGAAFGGEHSGHYYFRENYRADGAVIATLIVLEVLSRHPGAMNDLVLPLDRYAGSGEINFVVSDTAKMIEKVANAYSDADQHRLDGITVQLDDWWFNLRPSNTEPLLRLNLEASNTAQMQRRVKELQALLALL